MNLRTAYFAVIGPAMVKRAENYGEEMLNEMKEEARAEDSELGAGLKTLSESGKGDSDYRRNADRRMLREAYLGEDTGLGNYGRVGSKGPSAEDAQALKGGPGFFSNLGSALKGAIMEDIPDAAISAGRSIAGGFNSMKDGLSEAYKGMQVPGRDADELSKLDDSINFSNNLRSYEEERKKEQRSGKPPSSKSTSGPSRFENPVGSNPGDPYHIPGHFTGVDPLNEFNLKKTSQAKVWHVMQGWKAGQITTDQIKQLPAHDLEKVANVVYNEARLGDQQAGLLWQLLNG